MKYCSYDYFEGILFYTYTSFDGLSNETKLSLLAAIVLEIFTFPSYFTIQRFKNLKIVITPEILIVQYLMTYQFLYSFQQPFKLFFSELASCHSLGDIRISCFLKA